jgi:hypothetical protein
LYECVVSGVLLQLRKIPKRASSVFPSQPCRKDFSHPGGKPDRCFVFLSPTVERRGRREREKETRVSVQKGRCLMVFLSALSFCFFSSFGLAMFGGIFDWCFLLSSFRLVQSILVSSNLCLYLTVVILYFVVLCDGSTL